MTGICPKSGKRRLTRAEANKQAGYFNKRWMARMRAYRCRSCDGWHIGNNRRKPTQRARRRAA